MSPSNSLSSPTSTAASTSPIPPATPLTPNSAHHVSFANPQNGDQQFGFDSLDNNTGVVPNNSSQGGPVRRKPSRRANTAERRATHNAVERQRRETLNGRFLDLAALLPNLASVRRPSKSAIVNSSIALIHTQRRSRFTAARELRLLKAEADALRAEVNEWRERAGMNLARIDEPIRSREFEELVSGGLEEAEETLMEEERRALEIAKEGLRLEAAGYGGDMIMSGNSNFAYNMNFGGLAEDDEEDGSSDGQSGRMRPASQGSNGLNSVPSLPMPIPIPRQNAVHSNPMIYDPSAALLQAHTTHNAGIQNFPNFDLGVQQPLSLNMHGLNNAKPVNRQQVWDSQMYNSNPYGFQQSFSPPSSSHGPASAGFLGGFGLMRDDDALNGGDASSVGSGSLPDMPQFNIQHPHQQAMQQAQRTRSASTLSTLQSLGSVVKASSATPPSSAPASATTYAEAHAAGDAFAAAYGSAFPMGVGSARVPGGGATYSAAMGLFM